MKVQSTLARLAALLLLTGCGGGNGSTNPDGGASNFTAKLDGAAWASATVATQAHGSAGGIYTLTGSPLASGATGMSITLYNIAEPGTYPLGVGGTVRGGVATLSEGSTAWSTPLSGSSGSVTLTAVSATHITGSFAFVAEPFVGGPPNNRTVTDGSFDLPVQSSGSVAVADNAGSRFGGMLGGAPWNAATVVMVSGPASGTLTLGLSNNAYNITMLISEWSGATAYTLNTGVARYMQVIRTGTTQFWGGSGALSSGTVTVTNATATRLQGSYDVSLKPGPTNAGAPDLALSGTFDIGITQ